MFVAIGIFLEHLSMGVFEISFEMEEISMMLNVLELYKNACEFFSALLA